MLKVDYDYENEVPPTPQNVKRNLFSYESKNDDSDKDPDYIPDELSYGFTINKFSKYDYNKIYD